MANYQEELEKFRQKWNLSDYNLDDIANSGKGVRYAEALLTGSSIDTSVSGEYVRWFSKTLELYFEENTTPNEDGKYMSSFNSQAFYNSFRSLVQAKYDADALGKNQKLLKVKDVENGQKKALENALAKNMSKYQKTLPAMWMENLKSKKWDMQSLENLTTNATNLMLGYAGDKANMEGNLNNVVVAYEAMRMLRESRQGIRGWFWKLFNGTRNEQENKYFLQLESQLSELDSKGYEIDKVIIGRTSKTVLGEAVESRYKVIEKQYEELNNQANLEEAANVDNSDLNENLDNSQQEEKENTLSGQLKGKASSIAVDKFAKKITPTLPKPIFGGDMMVGFGVQRAVEGLNKVFDELNKNYEAQMNAGNKETAMAEYALKVFSIALVSMQEIGYENGKENVLAAQKFTDAFLKEFSPCSTDDSLQEFADNYAIKNSDKIIDSLKAQVEPSLQSRLDDGFKDVQKDLFPEEEEERTQAFQDGEIFAENNVNKSVPVHSQPQISALNLDRK